MSEQTTQNAEPEMSEEEGKQKDLIRMYTTVLERTRSVTRDVEQTRQLVSSMREPSATLSDA